MTTTKMIALDAELIRQLGRMVSEEYAETADALAAARRRIAQLERSIAVRDQNVRELREQRDAARRECDRYGEG